MHEQVSFNSQEHKQVSRCPVYHHIPNTSKYLTKKLEKLLYMLQTENLFTLKF